MLTEKQKFLHILSMIHNGKIGVNYIDSYLYNTTTGVQYGTINRSGYIVYYFKNYKGYPYIIYAHRFFYWLHHYNKDKDFFIPKHYAIYHKDKNKLNNKIDNLDIRFSLNASKNKRGENILKEEAIKSIRNSKLSSRVLAKKFNTSHSTIQRIKAKQSYKGID